MRTWSNLFEFRRIQLGLLLALFKGELDSSIFKARSAFSKQLCPPLSSVLCLSLSFFNLNFFWGGPTFINDL